MTGPSPTRSVFLIGFMGAGKTSVGKELAGRIGWPFFDLDQVIEAREQATVDAIFASAGEAGFRRAENAALLELMERELARADAVVALGGGAFAQPENRRILQQAGAITILLDAPLEELERRCRNAPDVRPLARDRAGFQQLFADRREAYGQARYRIDTAGREIEQVVREIARLLGHEGTDSSWR
ncbi:MAG: shikimate kinase [Acidobacteriia bacterium]|nr:shikimate kinase [Terriglobia bacterium]